jgi:hypothetical protein
MRPTRIYCTSITYAGLSSSISAHVYTRINSITANPNLQIRITGTDI